MKNCVYIIIVQVSPCYHTSSSFTSLHALEKKTQPPYEKNKEKGGIFVLTEKDKEDDSF